MLIIRRIFHISTLVSRAHSLSIVVWFCDLLFPPSFFGCARGVFYRHTISLSTYSSRLLLICCFFWWYLLDVMIFCGAILFFFVLGAFSRVCRLFALFSPCWLPINTFFSLAFPRCRRSVPMFSVVFSTFHVKHCCFLYEILPLLCSFFTVSGAIFCGFCCLVFLILSC